MLVSYKRWSQGSLTQVALPWWFGGKGQRMEKCNRGMESVEMNSSWFWAL